MNNVPVVYSAHHASSDFGYKDFSKRCALTPEQRVRFSDYGTEMTVPKHGITPPLIAQWSRGIVNLNGDKKKRFRNVDYAKSENRITEAPNTIWRPGMEPTNEEKTEILHEIYEPYYKEIINDLRSLEKHKYLLVFAWDNTADYSIGQNQSGENVFMPDVVVSNRGGENSAEKDADGICKDEETSCTPALLTEFASQLHRCLKEQGLPDEVYMNLVYRGGNITRTFSHRRHSELNVQARVESLQLEYNTRMTHDQETLRPYSKQIEKLRTAAERAMEETYKNTGSQLIGLPSVPRSL